MRLASLDQVTKALVLDVSPNEGTFDFHTLQLQYEFNSHSTMNSSLNISSND